MADSEGQQMIDARSSNGRIAEFDSADPGSSPGRASSFVGDDEGVVF